MAAFSAGSRPRGAVHPYALELLRSHGFDTARLRSKGWDEFAKPDLLAQFAPTTGVLVARLPIPSTSFGLVAMASLFAACGADL